MYLLCADGLFSWIEFSTDKFKNPLVITGLVIIFLGIISAIVANPVNNLKKVQELEQKMNKSDTFIAGVLRIGGYLLIVIGCIIAATIK